MILDKKLARKRQKSTQILKIDTISTQCEPLYSLGLCRNVDFTLYDKF